jgi:menaquinone-dependent protoporphyrinogen oxidase
MPRILILYGTTEGHTEKVARFLTNQLRWKGAIVHSVQAGPADPDPGEYDAVIVAASVHAGGYQSAVVRWARAHAEALSGKPSAFVSVCLAVLQKDLKVQRELGAIVNRFEARTGWKPAQVKLVAGALPYTRYGWLKRMLMRRIVKKAGGATDVSRDHEYTDWDDLGTFAAAFFAPYLPESLPEEACGAACCCSGAGVAA